jgi:hypothetical protein
MSLFLTLSEKVIGDFLYEDKPSSPWPHWHGAFTQPAPSNHENVLNSTVCDNDFTHLNQTSNSPDYIDYAINLADLIYPAFDLTTLWHLRLTQKAPPSNPNFHYLAHYEKIKCAWEVYNYAILGLFLLKMHTFPDDVFQREVLEFHELAQQPDPATTLNVISSFTNDRRDATCGFLQFLYHTLPWDQKWNDYIQENLLYQSTDFLIFLNFFINFSMDDTLSIYQPANNIEDLFALLTPNSMLCSVSRAGFRLLTLAPGTQLNLEKSPLFPGMYTLFGTLPTIYALTHLALKNTFLDFECLTPIIAESITLHIAHVLEVHPYICMAQMALFVIGQTLYYTSPAL